MSLFPGSLLLVLSRSKEGSKDSETVFPVWGDPAKFPEQVGFSKPRHGLGV